ncbi:MAG: NUDIX domain-containing protein [Candidatus Promineifilaceae bacterium]
MPHADLNSAPAHIAYCPLCGHSLITRQVGDRERRVCPDCGYVHYTDPKVGVGALVTLDGKVLLVKRIMNPERGKWSIPAGFLDRGEDPRRTAEREVWEETGLRVRAGELLDVFTNPPEQGGASIFVLYRADLLGGELEAGDDAADAAFFALDKLPELAFASTRAAIAALSQQNGLE